MAKAKKKSKVKVKAKKKITIVRSHARRVPKSKKNPKGVTIVDRHARRIPGTYLDAKDLKNPNIAIPMGIRWLFRKRETARAKLKRTPTDIELILEYKGLLKSKTPWKRSALDSFNRHFKKLKK